MKSKIAKPYIDLILATVCSDIDKTASIDSPFGAKICSDICPLTLSVPRSEQFSESVAPAWT